MELAARSPRRCSTKKWMPWATPATSTTPRISITDPSGTTSPALMMSCLARPESAWINRDLEQKALAHAISEVVPEHLKEVRDRRSAWIVKARAAVKDRLTKEIGYWDHRAQDLKLQEQAGKANARLNSRG